MAFATRLVLLTAVHALSAWLALAGDDHACKCVFEVGAVPEPNRAVLELLEKQLDRCHASTDRQTCPACPPCPAAGLGQQAVFPAFAPGDGNLSAGMPAWTVSLLLGMLLGRLSYLVVPLNTRAATRAGNKHSGGNYETRATTRAGNKHSGSNYEGDHGLRPDHYDQQTDMGRQMTEDGADVHEDSCEAGLGASGGRLEGEMASDARGPTFAQGPAGAAEEGDSSLCRLEDDLEDEEKLGITDAGDEEWTEVLDVIREHSAVTIFNHTDSTWYVSSKHPHFVRPLHGKHRHPLRQSQQSLSNLNKTWTQNAAITSEGQPMRQGESEVTFSGVQQRAEQDPEVFKDEYGDHCSPVLQGAGTPARNAPQRIQRRPRSAPSSAYGRADVFEGQISSNMLQHASTSGLRSAIRSPHGDSHQRCASADRAQLSAHEPQSADTPRTLIRDDTSQQVPGQISHSGMRSGTIGQSMCQFRSASPPIFEDRSYED